VAAGLDLANPDIYVYRQSQISAHSELTWILDCFTGFGEMRRMTQFKDKSGAQDFRENIRDIIRHVNEMAEKYEAYGAREAAQSFEMILTPLHELEKQSENDVSVGLFNYPVLMAADILLYSATYIPVGDDQTQHLEFTRDIATRINNRFGEIFTIPLPVSKQHAFFGKDQGLRIRDLIDPTKKMSKSDDTGKGVIFLGDNPSAAAKKIMSATTDSFGEIRYDLTERPGITNLLQILALLTERPQDEVNAEWEGKTSYGELKKTVADTVFVFLTEFQERLQNVDMPALEAALVRSETAMRATANQTLLRVQQAVGLRAKS
jgi:tryptophanyl-tRNA synthetase